MARNSIRLFIPVLIILNLALQATAAYVNISSTSAIPGSNFSMNIMIAPGDSEVYGVQYDLSFDNSKLSAVSQDTSTFLSYDGAATSVITNSLNNTLGKIQYAETRLQAQRGVNATGTLTVITFFLNSTVIPGEKTALNLSNVILADPNGTEIPSTVNNGTVTAVSSLPTPTPTPLPTSTPSPTPAATASPTPTATPAPSTTASPTPAATVSPTPAATPTPSSTASPTPTATILPTSTATPTPTPTKPLDTTPIADAGGPYLFNNVPISFNGSASGGTPPYNYSWNFGDGTGSNLQNPAHMYSSAGNYTVTLTVTDITGKAASDSAQVVFFIGEDFLVAEAFGPYSGIVNVPISLNGSASGVAPPYNYSWNFGDGTSSNLQNPTHIYSNAGNYTVTLTVTGSGQSFIDAAQVTVYPGIKGDANSDSNVTIVDALFVAQHTVSLRTLTASQLAAGDVNSDGQVSIVDALFIAQYTVGLRQL